MLSAQLNINAVFANPAGTFYAGMGKYSILPVHSNQPEALPDSALAYFPGVEPAGFIFPVGDGLLDEAGLARSRPPGEQINLLHEELPLRTLFCSGLLGFYLRLEFLPFYTVLM